MSVPFNTPMGHGNDNDGIEEYENPLPTWWLGLLYATIVIGVVYGVDYHFVSNRSQVADYDAEVAEAPAAGFAATTVVVTPEVIAAGKAIFMANCVACHGADLHGGVGPDLTDRTWIHGDTLPEITNVIMQGVPEKGMLTWGPILGPQKVAEVAAFVHASGGGN